ncbi:helix-turn-helix domain-containing protein [Nocardioides sp. TF02-7]|uniref:TetR/AcrR family transcriptional regulator n=1 Tax=Nocardioides sp. TF02-7 TaxID=2917724 RepID=UPI001F063C01|nr:helix-turn-helix domain-containing protein [Nocardioides sp. TF02-7]UMG94347.1 TetR/AcrR family transcriptional regulator [Nocardioides sp. TF02-7]
MTATQEPTRREQILATAADLFAARGFHGVSVAELGAACGISGPALYKHFPSKQAMLAEMLVSISERLLAVGRERVAAAPEPAAAVRALVDWHVDFALGHRSLIVVQDRDWESPAGRRPRPGTPAPAAVRRRLGRPAPGPPPGPGHRLRTGCRPRGLRPAQLHPRAGHALGDAGAARAAGVDGPGGAGGGTGRLTLPRSGPRELRYVFGITRSGYCRVRRRQPPTSLGGDEGPAETTMSTTTAKIATAVAGGYLLGRTKKLRLAITIAGLLAGRKLSADPKSIANKIVGDNPELQNLRGQLTEGLTSAAKELAMATAASRIESMTESLQGTGKDGDGSDDEEAPDQEAPEDEAPDDEAPDDEAPEDEAPEDEPEDEDAGAEDEAADEPEDEPEEEPEQKPRKSAAKKSSPRKRASKSSSSSKSGGSEPWPPRASRRSGSRRPPRASSAR